MNREFKSCISDPPDNGRYVSVMFGTYETVGCYEQGQKSKVWLVKGVYGIEEKTPDTWCEIDWKDIVFSGLFGEKEPWKKV